MGRAYLDYGLGSGKRAAVTGALFGLGTCALAFTLDSRAKDIPLEAVVLATTIFAAESVAIFSGAGALYRAARGYIPSRVHS